MIASCYIGKASVLLLSAPLMYCIDHIMLNVLRTGKGNMKNGDELSTSKCCSMKKVVMKDEDARISKCI